MFDKFGEFDHFEEINKAAEGLKTEGDIDSLKELARENGIDPEDVEDYINGINSDLTNRSMAALGKLEIEIADLKPKDIMVDWSDYIRTLIISGDELFQTAYRRKGKSLKGCIGALLKWSNKHMHDIDKDIEKAAGFTGKVKLGIPGSARAKKIIKEYYLEG